MGWIMLLKLRKLNKVKKMIKTKKAIILPETLKIVIAVVCLFFLIVLAYKLYGVFLHKQEIEQARATVSNIDFILHDLKEGQEKAYQVMSPVGWYFLVFDKITDASEKTKEAEICICPIPQGYNPFDEIWIWQDKKGLDENGWREHCHKTGACKDAKNLKRDFYSYNFEEGVVSAFGFRIDRVLTPVLRKEGEFVYISGYSRGVYLEVLDRIINIENINKIRFVADGSNPTSETRDFYEKFKTKSGEIIEEFNENPKNSKILLLVAYPRYNPVKKMMFDEKQQNNFIKNRLICDSKLNNPDMKICLLMLR